MMEPLNVLLLALLMDLLLGDPEVPFHPVRIMGLAISKTEDWLRGLNYLSDRLKGILLLLFTTCAFTGSTWALLHMLWALGPIIGTASSSIVLYFTIGMKCLANEALSVHDKLKNADIAGAQARLSRIVGRDTAVLDKVGIARATIETVSENLVDAILAPIFYWTIFGTPGAICYRVVNTLDAMVGYKEQRYRELGWASAKLDDVLNFIPARIAPFAIQLATLILQRGPGADRRFTHKPSLIKNAMVEGKGHESPNSAISEAAFAHSLGVSLGGPTLYRHGLKERPFLNGDAPPPVSDHILLSVKLMYTTVIMVVTAIWIALRLKGLL